MHFAVCETNRFLCVNEEQDTGVHDVIWYWIAVVEDRYHSTSVAEMLPFWFFFLNFIFKPLEQKKKNFKRNILVVEWNRSAEIQGDLSPCMIDRIGISEQRSYLKM